MNSRSKQISWIDRQGAEQYSLLWFVMPFCFCTIWICVYIGISKFVLESCYKGRVYEKNTFDRFYASKTGSLS